MAVTFAEQRIQAFDQVVVMDLPYGNQFKIVTSGEYTMQPKDFDMIGACYLPGHLGIVVTHMQGMELTAEMAVKEHLKAPNGFLHAGSVVTLADSCAGYCCSVNLPRKAKGFTTIELKSNFLGTAREGTITCTARAVHSGRKTQVWDAEVRNKETGKTIALFRCTQMILY